MFIPRNKLGIPGMASGKKTNYFNSLKALILLSRAL